jgi:hypothetical protein
MFVKDKNPVGGGNSWCHMRQTFDGVVRHAIHKVRNTESAAREV